MKHFLRLSFFLSLAVFSTLDLSAQTERTLEGKVVDSNTGDAVAFAYVVVGRAQQRGVLTNELGEYSLRLLPEDLLDTLFVTRIGYRRFAFSLEDLEADQTTLDISLESEYVTIPVITVRATMTPEYIIQQTLKLIPENYGAPRFLASGYYRQFGLRNGAYTDLTEAYVTIDDQTYNDPKYRSTVYLDHLEREQFTDQETSDLFFGSENPIYSLYEKQNNSARYHHIHWMSFGKTKFFDAFDFEIINVYARRKDTIVAIGYEINLEKAGLSEVALKTLSGWTRGEVWINVTDYAIIRNMRGDENGNVYSEVYYNKAANRYYPSRITSVYAIDYGDDEYFITNRMLYLTDIVNVPEFMRQYKPPKRLNRKKSLGEVEFDNEVALGRNRILTRIAAPKAEEIDAARRAYQQRLGIKKVN